MNNALLQNIKKMRGSLRNLKVIMNGELFSKNQFNFKIAIGMHHFPLSSRTGQVNTEVSRNG